MNLALIDPFSSPLPDRITQTLALPSMDSTNTLQYPEKIIERKKGTSSNLKKDNGGKNGDSKYMSFYHFESYRESEAGNSLKDIATLYDVSNEGRGLAGGDASSEEEEDDDDDGKDEDYSSKQGNREHKRRKKERDKLPQVVSGPRNFGMGEYPTVAKFNRRGSHLAIGYSTGKIAIHDFVSGNVLSALYWPINIRESSKGNSKEQGNNADAEEMTTYYWPTISFLYWGKRGRSLLVGSVHSRILRLFDLSIARHDSNETFLNAAMEVILPSRPVSLHIHPKFDLVGTAALEDGRIVIFKFSNNIQEKEPFLRFLRVNNVKDNKQSTKRQRVDSNTNLLNNIHCAIFLPDRHSRKFSDSKILAVSNEGYIMTLAFPMNANAEGDWVPVNITVKHLVESKSGFLNLVISRNGAFVCVTSSRDNKVRMYSIDNFINDDHKNNAVPLYTFQVDGVSKEYSCSMVNFSGQTSEYVITGCNNGDSYELHFWDTSNGQLIELLKGPRVQLNCVDWHPTRPFVAVATSDSFVDIWGPNLNWKNFAPDFHALHENIEYIEKEDEFDIVVDNLMDEDESESKNQDEEIDICTIEPNAVFQSDSEDESDIFRFPLIPVKKLLKTQIQVRKNSLNLDR